MGFSKLFGFLRGAKGDLYFLSLHAPLDATVLTGIFVLVQLRGLAGHGSNLLFLLGGAGGGVGAGLFSNYHPLHILDGYLRHQVNLEAGWVLPLLGWCKPVLAADMVALFLMLGWIYWVRRNRSAQLPEVHQPNHP